MCGISNETREELILTISDYLGLIQFFLTITTVHSKIDKGW